MRWANIGTESRFTAKMLLFINETDYKWARPWSHYGLIFGPRLVGIWERSYWARFKTNPGRC